MSKSTSEPRPTRVRSSIHRLFSTLIKPFMSEPTPPIFALFLAPEAALPVEYPTAHWRDVMLNVEPSAGVASRSYVEQVAHCKAKRGKKHEFLEIIIRPPAGSSKAVVIAGRSVAPLDPTDDTPRASTLQSGMISPSSPPTPAADLVTIATRKGPSEISLKNMLGPITSFAQSFSTQSHCPLPSNSP